MLIDQISALVTQDPQEMMWIETQASIFIILAIILLLLWPLAEFYRYFVKDKHEDLVARAISGFLKLELN